MALLGVRLAVSLPDTVLEEKDALREKTAKLGTIARACSIYGVDMVEVYHDPRGRGESPFIQKILQYLETPQYLRKRLFPLDEALKFAGALPPLRIPSHKARTPMTAIKAGEVREGVSNGDGTADIGLDAAPRLSQDIPAGRRITTRVTSVSPFTADVIPRERAGSYWGYSVEAKSAEGVLADQRFKSIIATSRLGSPLRDALAQVRGALGKEGGVKLLFGAPSKGVFEIFGKDLGSRVTLVVNLFPHQQVETVRTEEAVFAGLGLVALVCAEKA